MDLTETERRVVWLGTLLAGVAHLVAPGLLLATARRGYRRVLAVRFDPEEGARRRVRGVGLALLALAAALRRLLHR